MDTVHELRLTRTIRHTVLLRTIADTELVTVTNPVATTIVTREPDVSVPNSRTTHTKQAQLRGSARPSNSQPQGAPPAPHVVRGRAYSSAPTSHGLCVPWGLRCCVRQDFSLWRQGIFPPVTQPLHQLPSHPT